MLNPQPLPPEELELLNPQPLPPEELEETLVDPAVSPEIIIGG